MYLNHLLTMMTVNVQRRLFLCSYRHTHFVLFLSFYYKKHNEHGQRLLTASFLLMCREVSFHLSTIRLNRTNPVHRTFNTQRLQVQLPRYCTLIFKYMYFTLSIYPPATHLFNVFEQILHHCTTSRHRKQTKMILCGFIVAFEVGRRNFTNFYLSKERVHIWYHVSHWMNWLKQIKKLFAGTRDFIHRLF